MPKDQWLINFQQKCQDSPMGGGGVGEGTQNKEEKS